MQMSNHAWRRYLRASQHRFVHLSLSFRFRIFAPNFSAESSPTSSWPSSSYAYYCYRPYSSYTQITKSCSYGSTPRRAWGMKPRKLCLFKIYLTLFFALDSYLPTIRVRVINCMTRSSRMQMRTANLWRTTSSPVWKRVTRCPTSAVFTTGTLSWADRWDN